MKMGDGRAAFVVLACIVGVVCSLTAAQAKVSEYHLTLAVDGNGTPSMRDIVLEEKSYPDAWNATVGSYRWEAKDDRGVIVAWSAFDTQGDLFYDSIDPETGEIADGGTKRIIFESVELYVNASLPIKTIVIARMDETAGERMGDLFMVDPETGEVTVNNGGGERPRTQGVPAAGQATEEKGRDSMPLLIFLAMFLVVIGIVALVARVTMRQDL